MTSFGYTYVYIYCCSCHCLVINIIVWVYRSSGPEVFYAKGVLKNFPKFREKHLRWSLFFDKAAGMRPATL